MGSDSVQNAAGGTTSESDIAMTSDEHRRAGRCEQDGSNMASVTSRKYAGCREPCTNGASGSGRRSTRSSVGKEWHRVRTRPVSHEGLQPILQRHESLPAASPASTLPSSLRTQRSETLGGTGLE